MRRGAQFLNSEICERTQLHRYIYDTYNLIGASYYVLHLFCFTQVDLGITLYDVPIFYSILAMEEKTSFVLPFVRKHIGVIDTCKHIAYISIYVYVESVTQSILLIENMKTASCLFSFEF